jgi:hypothetical protein
MAELCAKMSKTPKTNSTTIMGSIHHRLLLQKKASSSPAIPKRRLTNWMKLIAPSLRFSSWDLPHSPHPSSNPPSTDVSSNSVKNKELQEL